MEEVGGRSQPPGDPPDAPGLWVQKVRGSIGGGMPRPEEVVTHEFVKPRFKIEFPNGKNGEPRCMIVKVLGRTVPVAVLSRRLKEMWKPSRDMVVVDLPRQFFMVRFESEDEYMAALTGGPWRVFGSYLMVQAWSPDFDPIRDEIETTPVWVRLSNLPVSFYHTTILMGIAEGLGKPIKVDITTMNLTRARFARVCVEVNLKMPLKGTVMINEERYYVSYEGLSTICSGCGLYGHLVHSCPQAAKERPPEQSTQVGNQNGSSQTVDGFQPVRRGGRRPETTREGSNFLGNRETVQKRQNIREVQRRKENPDVPVKNSFGRLVDDLEDSEVMEKSRSVEENKENRYMMNQVEKEKSAPQGMLVVFGSQRGNKLGRGDLNNVQKKAHEKLRMKQATKTVTSRGLVFGPIRGEAEFSSSGKRLRLEQDSPPEVTDSGNLHSPNEVVEFIIQEQGRESNLPLVRMPSTAEVGATRDISK
ncbi:hypothetical protein CARUB_v10002911mg [Capsella rubella]|uniref:DUF4283 domain-containing protein n=1 Tax=Capsella rubella TaxID=81985 RepID=R0HBB0_9BRAS|nr:hypothetical protein CARUB_v10002911mg [Capsella rubella]